MSKKEEFEEMPFSVAIKKYPAIKSLFPLEILLDFVSDDKYIVRLSNKRLEIGYKDDQWLLGGENV